MARASVPMQVDRVRDGLVSRRRVIPTASPTGHFARTRAALVLARAWDGPGCG